MGGITDENAREMKLSFDFLPAGKSYQAILYRDTETSHYRENPMDIAIEPMTITSESSLDLKLAAGGGFAISLIAE